MLGGVGPVRSALAGMGLASRALHRPASSARDDQVRGGRYADNFQKRKLPEAIQGVAAAARQASIGGLIHAGPGLYVLAEPPEFGAVAFSRSRSMHLTEHARGGDEQGGCAQHGGENTARLARRALHGSLHQIGVRSTHQFAELTRDRAMRRVFAEGKPCDGDDDEQHGTHRGDGDRPESPATGVQVPLRQQQNYQKSG